MSKSHSDVTILSIPKAILWQRNLSWAEKIGSKIEVMWEAWAASRQRFFRYIIDSKWNGTRRKKWWKYVGTFIIHCRKVDIFISWKKDRPTFFLIRTKRCKTFLLFSVTDEEIHHKYYAETFLWKLWKKLWTSKNTKNHS